MSIRMDSRNGSSSSMIDINALFAIAASTQFPRPGALR
jgi:hypothetical protein